MLTAVFTQNQQKDVLDLKILSTICLELLEPKPGEYDEALNIELVQLATLLIKHMSNELSDHRKELIKFAWNHLKSEDTNTRQWAYLLVCRFIEAFDTPPKIILQIYIGLLRASQPESRSLVKQALDILTPTLQKRLGSSDVRYPNWLRWTKKLLIEEGHSLPQLVHMLQLIVRHPQLFYPSRAHFVPQMVNAFARIGLLPNSPHENRKLAVDMAEIVINWEKQRIDEINNPKPEQPESTTSYVNMKLEDTKEGVAPMEVDEITKTPPPQTLLPLKQEVKPQPGQPGQPIPPKEEEFKVGPNITEMMSNFLIRIASTGTDSAEYGQLPQRALDLLKQTVTLWPTVNIKFAYFEKLLSPVQEQPLLVVAGWSILTVLLDFLPPKFVVENLPAIQHAIPPSLQTLTNNAQHGSKIITALRSFLEKMMKVFPPSQSSEIQTLYNILG